MHDNTCNAVYMQSRQPMPSNPCQATHAVQPMRCNPCNLTHAVQHICNAVYYMQARQPMPGIPCQATHAMQPMRCNPYNATHAMQHIQCNPCNVTHAVQHICMTTHAMQYICNPDNHACQATHAVQLMRCNPCNATHAMQPMQCNPCNATHAMQPMQCNPCNAAHAMQPMQCNPCNVIIVKISSDSLFFFIFMGAGNGMQCMSIPPPLISLAKHRWKRIKFPLTASFFHFLGGGQGPLAPTMDNCLSAHTPFHFACMQCVLIPPPLNFISETQVKEVKISSGSIFFSNF